MKRYILLYSLLLFFSTNCYAKNVTIDPSCVANEMKTEFTKAEIKDMEVDVKKNNGVLSKKYQDRFNIIIKKCLQ
jgi:hypothetical protein